MKFLLDHDVPEEVAHLLRHWGHELSVARDALKATAPDQEIFDYACRNRLMLITCNRNDFLELARAKPDHPGLIILIRRRTRQMECARLRALLTQAGETGIRGNINFA